MVDEAAELLRLVERRDREAGGAALERGVRDRHCAVPVAVGLDDGEEPRAPRQVTEDSGAVGADRAQVDLSPAERAAQSPPWRSTFMTSGISGRRSLARSPESPIRSAIWRPAAAWM